MSLEDPTVELILREEWREAGITVRQIGTMLMTWKVLAEDQVATFLGRVDVYGARAEGWRFWRCHVVNRFLKFVGSEYAVRCFPDRDTSHVTNLVRVFIQEETLVRKIVELLPNVMGSPVMTPQTAAAVFHTTLFLLILYADSLRPAVILVLHIFRDIRLTHECFATKIPQLLNFFRPGQSWQGTTTEDRLEVIFHELQVRGYEVEMSIRTHVTAGAGPSDDVRVQFHDITRDTRAISLVRVSWQRPDKSSFERKVTPSQLYGLIIEECVLYRESSVKNVRVGAKGTTKELQGTQLHRLTTLIKRILRLKKDVLRCDAAYHEILQSEGWVPLSMVNRYMEVDLAARQETLPAWMENVAEEFLLSHDNYRRFELGICEVNGSQYNKRRCARALYGHDLGPSEHSLDIISSLPRVSLTDLSEVPKFGWIAVDKSAWIRLKSTEPGLALFDKILFTSIYPTEAIGAFRRYRECTRAERQLDEKLRGTKSLRFMEVYLHALVLDQNMTVYCRDSAEAAHQRCWYAFPNYMVNLETRAVRPAGEKDQYTPFRVLPKIFFTGRQVTMTSTPSEEPNELSCNERVLESDDDSVATGIPRRGTSREFALPATNIVSPCDDVRHTDWYLGVSGVPVTVLPAAWRWTAASHYSAVGPFPDGFPFAWMMETLADVFASYHSTDRRLQLHLQEEEAVYSVTQLHPSLPTVRSKELNLTPLRQEVEKFLKDGERFSMQLHVPLSGEESSHLENRSKHLKELKVWIVQQGLTYTQLSSACAQGKKSDSEGAAANSAPLTTTLELWKPFRWSERELTAVIRELGLEKEHTFVTEQLKLGLTRHCENKINNYEILEFLGDAVMDFIVPLDAFLSSRLIPMTARQLILHPLPAAGDSDRGPPCLEALFLNVGETINSSLCCNKVIACLLPPAVSAHFDRLYGAEMREKVKADVFESILGAVYKSLGMEAVRQLMTRLFSGLREVYVRITKANSQVEAAAVALFKAAIENCPYLFDYTGAIARKLPLHFCGFDAVLVERYVTSTEECSLLRAHNTHTCSQPFPRIQDKDYATHFTTGAAYSYRRIRSVDTVRLFHRIAAIFAKTSGTAFTNEVITPTTHLVVDFDSANIRSWGGLNLFHQWSRKALGSAVCMVLLDCSGHSKVKKKLLNSYHIHFPQVVVGLRELERLLLDLRNFFYESVEKQRIRHQDSTAALQHVTVLMTASFVKSQLIHWRLQPQRHHWTYCTFDDLRTLSGACPVLRFAALEHIGELVMAQDVEMFSRVFGVTDESRCLCTVLEDVAVVEDSKGHRWMVPQSWVIPKVGNGVKVKLDFPEKNLWEDIVDTNIVQSQKLRMYLCDKYDIVTLSEYRPLYADAMMLPRSDGNVEEVRIVRPNCLSTTIDKMRRCEGRMIRLKTMIECWASSSLPSSGDDNEDTTGPIEAWTFDELAFHDYAVMMPHLLLLRLTSLRTPTHFDTDALQYDVWRHHSESVDAEVDGSDVTLPTYADVVGQRWPGGNSAPQCDSWTVWLNTFEISDAKGKPQACSPAWWAYNRTNKAATFYVASLPIYRVDGYSSLVEALESQGGNGMKTIARFFIPHVQCTENPTIEKWTSANPDIFPLFVKPTSKLQKVRQLFPSPQPVATGSDVFPTGRLRVRCMNLPEDPAVYKDVEALAQWWWLAISGVLRLSLCDNPVLVLAEDEALCKELHQAWRGHPLRRGLASPPIWALDTVSSRLGQSQLPGGGTLPKGTFYFPIVFVTHRDAASCAKILPAAKKNMMAGLSNRTVTWYVASVELEAALRRHTS